MRAIEAGTFSGYGGLRQTELPKPQPSKDRVLVRVTAAGVTPLDHTILSGGHPRAKAPLVLGNEGAGVIEDAGESGLAVGSRVMFTGPYGVAEPGAWQDWLLVRPEHLALVPYAIDDVVAASLPVAYLTAQSSWRAPRSIRVARSRRAGRSPCGRLSVFRHTPRQARRPGGA